MSHPARPVTAAPRPARVPGRPLATVSVDVDPVDLHLVGYGYRGLPADPLVYQTALPRLLEIFSRTGVRATFFLVARDAADHRDAIAALAHAGHEVASHSLTHPIAFASLPAERMREELEGSRHALEAAVGAAVIGYRSPNFDMSQRALLALLDAGYRYDASAYPTPFLIPARLLLAIKSRDPAAVFKLKAWPFTWRREPHAWRSNDDERTPVIARSMRANGDPAGPAAPGQRTIRAGERARALHEFPVSVTPGLRAPFYHTARYFMDEPRFERTLEGFMHRGEALSYPLHAVDALGLAEDHVDSRLARHPGMNRTLVAKLDLLERSLASIAARFECVPFRDRLPIEA